MIHVTVLFYEIKFDFTLLLGVWILILNHKYIWIKQDNVGWGVGLGVLAGVLAMALAIFLLGIKRYRKEGPTGSPFTRLAQVFVAASRKWRVQDTIGTNNFCYSQEDKHEPHHHHPLQPKYHTLLHTRQYRWVPLFIHFLYTHSIFVPITIILLILVLYTKYFLFKLQVELVGWFF